MSRAIILQAIPTEKVARQYELIYSAAGVKTNHAVVLGVALVRVR